jgi:hypothetical protein
VSLWTSVGQTVRQTVKSLKYASPETSVGQPVRQTLKYAAAETSVDQKFLSDRTW